MRCIFILVLLLAAMLRAEQLVGRISVGMPMGEREKIMLTSMKAPGVVGEASIDQRGRNTGIQFARGYFLEGPSVHLRIEVDDRSVVTKLSWSRSPSDKQGFEGQQWHETSAIKFSDSYFEVAEIADLLVKCIDEEGVQFEVQIENLSKEAIFVQDLNSQWIGVEFRLWSLGKGVLLYPPNDAAWRRNQAFVDMKWVRLGAGEKRVMKVSLEVLLPEDPENDSFAKSLMKDVVFLKRGDVVVAVTYRTSSSPDKEEFKLQKVVPIDFNK